MGRPIKKKFFGNLNNEQFGNVGTGSGIGGEGLTGLTASATKGSLVINATYGQPALQIPAPAIPTGVQATATVTWEVESVTVAAPALNGHSYTVTTGGATTLTGLTGPTFNITAVGIGQGEVQTIVPVNRGSFTTIPTAATTYQIVGGDGGNQATVKYRVKSMVLTNPGTGYDAVPSLTWSTPVGGISGVIPGNPTVSLTSTTQNAIEGTAYLLAKDGGSSAVTYDIVKQEASHRYLVKTAQGIGQCKLVASASPTAGQMTIIATATNGSTYYVTKLTAHKAILVYKSGTRLFADNAAAGWTLGAASTGIVSIDSA
jgi:hypothetical protein